MRRLLGLLLATTLPAWAAAQPFTPDAAVQQAFAALRPTWNLWLRLDGSDTVGSKVTALATDVYWSRTTNASGQIVTRLEARSYRNGSLATRLVGDGVVFWRYDAAANTYGAKPYGNYDGSMPPSYLSDLLQTFTSVANGTDGYLARLLREACGGATATFTRWMPADLAPLLHTSGSLQDPIVPWRTFDATPKLEFAIYRAALPGSDRVLAFELQRDPDPNPPNYRLGAISYAERGLVGNRAHVVEWRIEARPNAIPPTADFTFTIPAGAKPVVFRSAR
ncbi:MAG: hypothetical protein M9921_06480 [Fimbriimonadaceae bacterium]|nr:hypothetical protein [Chthonomonadaceae bacterium]MCO5296487.1 hypothetical protein [Fimbriimonadaceae bacterium]